MSSTGPGQVAWSWASASLASRRGAGSRAPRPRVAAGLDCAVAAPCAVLSCREKEREQLSALRKHHEEEIDHHQKEIERLQKEIERHKHKIKKLKDN